MDKPKLTAIDGGRKGPPEPPDNESPAVRHQLERLTIELMRAVARGSDHQVHVGEHLAEIAARLPHTKVPIAEIVSPVIRELHEALVPMSDDYDSEITEIVLAALQVAAERCCSDPAARGRAGKREEGLRYAVEQHVIGHERRARANRGGSYLKDLLKEYFGPRSKRSKWDDVEV